MLQWSMISVAPVLFFVGLVLVEHQRERASQAIKQLRSEQARDSATAPMSGGNMFARRRSVVASLNPLLSQEVAAGGRPGGVFTPTPSRNRRMSLLGTSSLRGLSGPGAPPAPMRPRRRDAYDEFFDFNSRYLPKNHLLSTALYIGFTCWQNFKLPDNTVEIHRAAQDGKSFRKFESCTCGS
jgi:hypothetical protein